MRLVSEAVANTGQPLLAEALRESLELAGYRDESALIGVNLGLCAAVNDRLVIKAPDWFYVAQVTAQTAGDRRSYTPHIEGEVPRVVMEFLSDTTGTEYSSKRTFPPGKWFFYEEILQVPVYVIFAPQTGTLKVHHLEDGRYQLTPPNAENRYWLADMNLTLGVWDGQKAGRSGYWLRWWDADGQWLPWADRATGPRTPTSRTRTPAGRTIGGSAAIAGD